MTEKELQRAMNSHNRNKGGGGGKGGGGRVIIVVVLLGIACFGGYRLIQSHRQAVAREQAEKEAQEQQLLYAKRDDALREERNKNKPVVIKGLYIGMPVSELANAVQTHLPGWSVRESGDNGKALYLISNPQIEGLFQISVGRDAQYKVASIQFEGKVCGAVFNAADLTAQQFVHEFVNAYNVPTMHAKQDFWESDVLPNNVLVRINDDKTVALTHLSNADAVKPRFD